jgi:uncharacterized protein YfaS (alpha-2-macroglobulin family)
MNHQNKMAIYSRAYLALMLHALGDDANAKDVAKSIEKSVVETAAMAHWEEEKVYRRWEYFASDGRTTAVVLRAMLAVDAENPLVQKTVRYLMRTRLGGYWRTTQETANTIIALTDYLALTGELEANFKYSVFVDNQLLSEQTITRDNVTKENRVKLVLTPGDHTVRLVRQGQGRLYYASLLTYYLEQETLGASKSLDGPAVHREYVDPKSDIPVKSYSVGDIIRVKVTIDMPNKGWYMMVTDPLPAGFEAINYSLNTSGVRQAGASDWEYYWSYPELHDDRAVFFTTFLWRGKHVFTYLVRATASGTFRALPAEVTPMYEPEVWGRSTSAAMAVGE